MFKRILYITICLILFILTSCVKEYTVSFNVNGGSVIDDVVFTNTETILDKSSSKSGYVFSGWYIDEDFSTIYNDNYEVKENITLYAKWEFDDKSNRLFPFKSDTKVGYIDLYGNVVIDASYENGTQFVNGFATVYSDSKVFVINYKGEHIIEEEVSYDPIAFMTDYYMFEGHITIVSDGVNVYNDEGDLIITYQLERTNNSYVSDEVIILKTGEKSNLNYDYCGYYDLNGDLLIDRVSYVLDGSMIISQFYKCYPFVDGLAVAVSPYGRTYIINKEGDIIAKEMASNLVGQPITTQKFYYFEEKYVVNTGLYYKLVNINTGIEILSFDDDIYSFSDSMILSINDESDSLLIFTIDGELISELNYFTANYKSYYSEGLIILRDEENNLGVLNNVGDIIIPFEYDDIAVFNNEYTVAKQGDTYYIYYKDGTIINQFNDIELIINE